MPSPTHLCMDCKQAHTTTLRCRRCFNIWRKKLNAERALAEVQATVTTEGQPWKRRNEEFAPTQPRQSVSAIVAPRSWWTDAKREGFTASVLANEIDRMRTSTFGQVPAQMNWGD